MSSIAPPSSASNTIEDPPNFGDIIKRTHPDKGKTSGSDKKQKNRGVQQFYCLICPNGTNQHRANAIYHCCTKHPVSQMSQDLQQRLNLPNTPLSRSLLPSIESLRRTFDRNAYKEAVIGLLTRRRLPFTSVEWPEMLLATNPEYGDLLIKSRRSVVRLIAANYNLYRDQLQNTLFMARSPIHLQTDVWTSPHRKAMIAICGQ